MNWSIDPVIRCVACKQLFVAATAGMPNKWGFNIPKDIEFRGVQPLSLIDCLEVLKHEDLLHSIGGVYAFNWYMDYEIDLDDKQVILQAGEITMRLTVWHKLNDLIRYNERVKLSTEQKQLFKENARRLIAIIPSKIIDYELMMQKAELHRNLGQFLQSLVILRKIKSPSARISRSNMIKLNLLLNRRLADVGYRPFNRSKPGRRLQQWKYQIEDFFARFKR